MKRLASLLLVVVLLATVVPASLLTALAADVSVIVPAVQEGMVPVYTGGGEADTFAVDFNLELADGIEAIAGYEVEISWDSSILAYDSLATFGPGIVGVEEGESSVVLAVANASDVLSGLLFTVNFCTLAAGDATVTVKVLSIATASGLIEADGGSLEFPIADGTTAPPVEVELNVNENDVLTDGKTGFTEGWNAPQNDVVLVMNGQCKEAPMNANLLYALGETKKIDSVIVDLYYDKNVMIGYPEGKATVLVSTDGETYTEVGKFDLEEADFSVPGTVSNTFEFDAVDAAYVKVVLYVGSNEAVLGDNPTDGKIFWEFISVAEFAVGEYVPPVEQEKHEIPVSHVNAYTWGVYHQMVIVGEGQNSMSKLGYDCTWWIALKVENIDEIYTVTAIEGNGEKKEMTAPADGFILYCFSNQADSFAAAGLVEVGDVMLSCNFDWRKNAASETPIGTMVFGPQPSKDHDHNYTSKVTKAPTLAAEGEMFYICVCGERYTDAIPAVKAQPDELVALPEGAYTLDYAGYIHAAEFSIVVGSNMTVSELTALGNNGAAKDMNYAYIIVVDANGKVVQTWYELAVSKAEVVCPAGGYIISYNGNKAGYEVLADISDNSSITLYNIDLKAIDGVADNVALTDAGFTVVRPEADVVIDVNEDDILTDGNTGFTGDWNATNGKVVLAQNSYCTTVGMNVTLLYALEETKRIESVTVDFYFDKNVMIGYPEGTATVLVSTDGETYYEVGTFALAEADLSVPGTVSNLFKFEATEAAYVKVELFVGSNEDVLGDNPTDGKIFWEFISVAEFAVADAPTNLAAGKDWTGDTDCGSGYVGDITDGVIVTWGAYDQSIWYGFDQRLTDDAVGTIIIDLGALYTNIDQIRAHVWPAGHSGIAAPQSYNFYISEDGETYTLLTSVAGFVSEPVWVTTDNADTFTARYIKLDIVGTKNDTFWFIDELQVNAYNPETVGPVIYDTPAEIMDAAGKLENGEILSDGHLYTLTGKIIGINTAFNPQYGNVTVTIEVEGANGKTIQCFRLAGEGADEIKIGDTITVTGVIKNFNGTIEFDAGCTLDSYVPGTPDVEIYETPEEIVNAAYELTVGETLSGGHIYTLTGVIVSVDTEYSEQYKNVTVTIVVNGMTDKAIQCYRLKGDGADVIAVGDTITVSGTIVNYGGTIEFNSGCVMDSYSKLENTKVDVNVNDNAILTDGKTGFTEGWDAPKNDVVLVQNTNCSKAGMDVTLLYALGETKKIDSVTVDLYFDKNVMIGYPEGQAIVLVSTDGETYTEVGKFDLTEADLSVPGTVSNVFEFEAVEAAYVKVLLYVGSNEAVLGDAPSDGKIFWEFISVAEFAVNEVAEYKFGDVTGDDKLNTADYVLLKRHVMRTYTLTDGEAARADMNGDGEIGIPDYVLLKRMLLGTWSPN